ncbi:MAG TPA: DMT family transporter, partial [Fervidobacterium sp.]|nr:DMT family transporter [Fervidobacterium sp.]
ERVSNWLYIFAALLLGFLSYGLSIFFYIYAQRYLGAAKTSAYYAVSPFIGAGLSLLIFRDVPTLTFLVALAIMLVGTYLASIDGKE